jgi:hypothetical protein
MTPNNGMKLTGQKRRSLCKGEEQRARHFRHAAHVWR